MAFTKSPLNTNPFVGASLLAKASDHSTTLQADPPLSRASSLPQENVINAEAQTKPIKQNGPAIAGPFFSRK
jgi:hypothetical protein